MQKERRTTGRDKLAIKPDGRFVLAVNNEQHELTDVIDVSAHGIGLALATYIDPGRTAQVNYRDGDAALSVTGTVTYCVETSRPGYRIGIMFDFPHQEESGDFYMRVKEYLGT